MQTTLSLRDPNLSWEGLVGLEEIAGGWNLWRLNPNEKALLNEGLALRAIAPSGVRLRFRSDARCVKVRFFNVDQAQPTGFEADVDGVEQCKELIGEHPLCTIHNPHGNISEWELRFPSANCSIERIDLEGCKHLEPWPDDRRKWITYGSSITHCRGTPYPSEAWPAIVARKLNLNHTSLGFGGQCHLDPLVARVIRDRAADLLSFCIGINIQGSESLGARAFIPNLIGFIQIVREKHPITPLLIISPIISPPRETTPNTVGYSLCRMREELHQAVATLREWGDQHVYYQDGLEIFGADDAHLLPDELHPNTQGYAIMGERIAASMQRHFQLP